MKSEVAMCKATPIKKNIPERQYVIREAPEGQTKISDKVCKRCMYHCLFGVSDRIVACMYADKEHHCRSLDDDYVHGYCKYYKKGKRKPGRSFNNNNLYIEMPSKAWKER